MSLGVNIFAPKPLQQQFPKLQTNPFLSYSSSRPQLVITSSRPRTSISCTGSNSSLSDAEVALKLAREVEKLNSQSEQREEALNKSRELLFNELSRYMGSEVEEAGKKWRKMSEDDKWAVVNGFVSEWSDNFHPLSARSVKELVDEYLVDSKKSMVDSGTMLFSSLRKLIGFSGNHSSSKG